MIPLDCRVCSQPLAPGKNVCPRCRKWTFAPSPGLSSRIAPGPNAGLVALSEVEDDTVDRLNGECWWAPLVGDGGFARGTTFLLGGEPGGGKSSFSVHFVDACIEETGLPALYLGIEEAKSKVRGRATRFGCRNLDRILMPEERPEPDLALLSTVPPVCAVVLDSMPYLVGHDDAKALEVCARLTAFAQESNAVVLILDHVTKGQDLAGLMALQHAVDATAYLRADAKTKRRTWTTVKNRNGDGFVEAELALGRTGLSLIRLGADEEDDEEAA